MVGLRWSLRVSVAGWAIYGAFAYAFADLGVIPEWVQSACVIIGSVLIVVGAESNTIATTEAALSKLGTDRISAWDYAAVVASLIGGLMTAVITFASRQVLLGGQWRGMALQWGPLVLGASGVLDFYGAVTELALARRDYVLDLGQWIEEERKWNETHGEPDPILANEPQFDPEWPRMTLDEWRLLRSRMNGDTPTDLRGFAVVAAREKRNMPPKSTAKRWLEMARE